MCLAVTYHLYFWQNDHDLSRATSMITAIVCTVTQHQAQEKRGGVGGGRKGGGRRENTALNKSDKPGNGGPELPTALSGEPAT